MLYYDADWTGSESGAPGLGGYHMKIAVIVVVVVLAIILFRLISSPSKSKSGPATAARKARVARATATAAEATEQRFRSVSVKCGPQACDTALALGDRRFLTGQLGKLPLAGCDSANCECKFEHHADRRESEEDKRAPSALSSELYTASGKPERRSRAGRRKSDFK